MLDKLQENIALVLEVFLDILQGLPITIALALGGVSGGLVLGLILALAKMSGFKYLRMLVRSYVAIFRGTPMLVQLLYIYFVLPSIGIQLSPISAGILGLALNSSAYISETIRAGIESIDRGQFEAAQALGIPKGLMWKDIVLPQAIRNILPALFNESITLIKDTSLIGASLGVLDILRRAQHIGSSNYNYILPFTIVALIYFITVSIFTYFANVLEKRLAI